MGTRVEHRSVVRSSVVLFSVGFLVARMVYLLGLFWIGYLEANDPVLTATGVVFRQAGLPIGYAGGVIFALGAAIVLTFIYFSPGPYGTARLAVLWTGTHLYREGLQGLVAGPLTPSGAIGRMYQAFATPPAVQIILALAAASALVAVAIWAGTELLRFALDPSTVADRRQRLMFMALTAGVPWVVGAVVAVVALVADPGLGVGLLVAGVVVLASLAASRIEQRWLLVVAGVPWVVGGIIAIAATGDNFALAVGLPVSGVMTVATIGAAWWSAPRAAAEPAVQDPITMPLLLLLLLVVLFRYGIAGGAIIAL